MQRFDTVIVGAGHGGAHAAMALRQRGYGGSIALVGDEPDLPYERPPLSKEYLAGEKSFDRLLIRPPQFWEDKAVTMLTGRRAVAIDPNARTLATADGGMLGYGTLVWAAGGAPRRLGCAGHSLRGVHSVRTRADVDQLAAELPNVQRVVVIGGGYIGLEAAAVLTSLGKSVTLLEAQDRLLARVAGRALSRFLADEHLRRGVDLRLGVEVACIEDRDGCACAVRLADGSLLDADMVIVGIGIEPAVAPLLAAGADGGNGVAVDRFCRTSLPDVYAIGDCADHANAFADGARIRLESVGNATDMAQTVARAMTGTPEPYATVPWFWSNQFDLRLQTVGLSIGHDAELVRGDPATRSFSILYLRDGRVTALDCVNATRDYVAGKALVTGRAVIDPARLTDAARPLKEIAAAANLPLGGLG